MLLALSIISSQSASLGPTAYKVFDQRGGSIGRIEGNDWVLPDPEKFVSSRHAQVRWSAGAFYLEDVSSNGTFINVPDRPVPRSQPMQLREGDRLFIGDYEIMVQLIDLPAVDATPAAVDSPHPVEMPAAPGLGLGTIDPLAALGAGRSAPRIPDEWQQTAFKGPDGSGAVGASQSRAQPPPTQTTSPGPAPAPTPTPQDSAAGSGSPAAAAAAQATSPPGIADLLAALGLDPARVEPAIQQQLGAILRIAVAGLVEVLKSRAQVKNSFRMPMTNIKPVENNPLKFSMNAQDAVYNLFVKRNPGYLGPTEAFTEGFQDIEFHQTAVLAGIRAAFNAMLAKFHPDYLEESYERKLKRTAMLGLGSRSKYWDLYRGQFEEIDRDREAHFQLLFGEEFAKAYNEHLQKLAADARLRRK